MAKLSFDLAAATAAFAAKGGKVETVAQGARAIESDRTIYAAMREGKRAVADSVAMTRESESRWEAQVGAYHAAKADGWSSANARDYAESAQG
jgi:hypothetical protein